MAVAAALLAALSGIGSPAARADTPVTVTTSGPSTIVTDTSTSTGRIVATFTVADTSLTATGAIICRGAADKKATGCQYRRFDTPEPVDEYGDPVYDDDEYTAWEVTGGPGNWVVQYPIGFDPISREQCLNAAWGKKPFSANMQVVNDDSTVLAQGSWQYAVDCTGIEGASSGPKRTRVYSGRTAESKAFTFWVLDANHKLNAFRVCRYNAMTDAYGACDYEDLASRHRTKDGWQVTYSLTFRPMGSSLCSWVGRTWPDAGFRMQFYSGDLDKELTLYSTTRLDC